MSKKGKGKGQNQQNEDDRFSRMKYDPKFLPIDGRIKVSTTDTRLSKIFQKDFTIVSKNKNNQNTENAFKNSLNDIYNYPQPSNDPTTTTTEDLTTYLDFDLNGVKRREEEEEEEKDEEKISLLKELEDDDEKNISPWDIVENSIKEVKEAKELSKRFAVVNHDFEVININDLYMIFQSNCLENGKVIKVTQYLSKYGEEFLRKDLSSKPEGVYLPLEKIELIKKEKENQEMKKIKKFNKEKRNKQKGKEIWEQKPEKPYKKPKIDEKDMIDMRKNLLYELKKLKLYFAVVEFDSVETATHVYDICNDLDIEDTQQYLDLRFIPPEKNFDDYVMENEPIINEEFDVTKYDLQDKGKVKLYNPPNHFTWDLTDNKRKKALTNKSASEEEILKYINLSPDEDDEDEEEIERIRSILLKSDLKEGDEMDIDEEEEEEEENDDYDEIREREEMEVTIPVYDTVENLEIQNKMKSFLNDKKLVKEETYEETRKRRKSEAQKKKKIERKKDFKKRMDEESSSDEDDEEDTERLKKLIRRKNEKESENEFDIAVDRQREMQRNKNKNINVRDTGLEVDISDRFKILVDNPEFNIDPSHKKFKKTKNYERIIKEKRKRKRNETGMVEIDEENFKSFNDDGDDDSKRKKKKRKY